MIHAAGMPDGFIAGFVSVMSEYVHMITSAGEPNLYVWQPEATMMDEEKNNYRIEFDRQLEEA
jgi:hypothetical protein